MPFRCAVVLAGVLVSAPVASAAPLLTESFDNVAGLTAAGWTIVNNSSPLGGTPWFQGIDAVFPAHSGAATSYAAANFNAAGDGGAISLWLITPTLSLDNGDTVSFYTRTNAGFFADRLQVRFSDNGGSADVGATAASVGDFDRLLGDINPLANPTGYPAVWTAYTFTLSGLAGPTSGRVAFRYLVDNTSAAGDYIGLDTLAIEAANRSTVPEPSLLLLGLGGVTLTAVRRRRRR